MAKTERQPTQAIRRPYGFDDSSIRWRRFASNASSVNSIAASGDDDPSEGMRYWVLGVSDARETVDILLKFDPEVNCLPHHHLGAIDTFVIEGEQRIYRRDRGEWKLVESRPPGHLSINDDGVFHYEGAGPDGFLVHMHMEAVNGMVWEVVDENDKMIGNATLKDFRQVLAYQRGEVPAPELGFLSTL